MSTTTEKGYLRVMLDQLEPAPRLAPGAPDDGRQRFDVRRRLGITSFGIQVFRAPRGVDVVREHDETLLGEAGQEELYLVLGGAATFEIDGERVEAPAGSFVHVQPTARRKATATEDGTTILVVGGTPGKAYEPAPDEAVEAFAAYNAGDYETAIAKQLVVLGKRPGDAVAHFNAGCFAALAGRADEAVEHLRRAVEINGASGSSWPPTRTSTRSAATDASPSWPRRRRWHRPSAGRRGRHHRATGTRRSERRSQAVVSS